MAFRKIAACSLVRLAGLLAFAGIGRADINQLRRDFLTPPDDARIMVRWWWFGPAVTREGIERELKAMKAGGIGGVELQCTYPLALDGGEGDQQIKNLKFLSPEHLAMIGFAAAKCKELGLRMDLTLGSGWPYGGPMFSAAEGAGALETSTVPVPAGQATVPIPQLRPGRTVFAAFAGPATGGGGAAGRGRGPTNTDLSGFKEIPIENGVAKLPADFTGGEVLFFISGRTGMAVKRPAFGAEGPVIDHLSGTVVDKFIAQVAEPELQACGDNPPYAIFCDSLEVSGENWTDDFLAQFQKLRGYDLRPYLPALLGNIGEATPQVRHDYGQTLTDIFNQNFNAKFQALAQKYHSRFRIQGYGSPPAGLYSYAYSDLPEGEGGGNGNWRTFRTTRYASSASHLLGKRVTSSETFTWLHGAPFRATPLDIKGEVDTHFLDGINQIICHGWPYTGNGVADPGWSFYAAAVFDEKNPWYIAMPEISGYMQRVSQMLREGTPANDIALYLPDSDVWTTAGTGYSSLNAAHTQLSGMVAQIVDGGYNLDGWDDGMLALKGKADNGTLAFGDMKYKVVVLDGAENMPLATARKLEEFSKGGGLLFAVLRAPSRVPGFKATADDQNELQQIMGRLFTNAGAPGTLLAREDQLTPSLSKKLPPDVAFYPATSAIGAVHRHTDDAEIYFLANTGNQRQRINAVFRVKGRRPQLWNPLTGSIEPLSYPETAPDGGVNALLLEFEPYGSMFIIWTAEHLPSPPPVGEPAPAIDLSTGWDLHLGEKAVKIEKLISWTEIAGMKNFSGVGRYEKTFQMDAATLQKGSRFFLSLGDGSPAAAGGGGRGTQGYSAAFAAAVRDAAVVYVNGQFAGAAWTPPYRVEVTNLLKKGDNDLRIDVANTAVNMLAARGFPNYDNAALQRVYGNRFTPQGLQLLSQPLPSGLLGPVQLKTSSE